MQPSPSTQPPIGLIAGQGTLPVHTARGIRAAGRQVVCVGLKHQFDAELPGLCDRFSTAGMLQLGKWIRLLSRSGAREAVMVGRVRKATMYEPRRWLEQLPDWRALWLWYRVLRHDRRNDAVLCAVADELNRAGITLVDSTQYIPDQLADHGVMTRAKPSANQLADIQFALPIVARMGELDVGQSIAVKDREVIAVEAIEGTDAMIARAGELCRAGKWTLIKIAKPEQDMRFDVPTVGMQTLERLHQTGGTCLAIEAGKVIMLDKQKLIERASQLAIAIIGVSHEQSIAPM